MARLIYPMIAWADGYVEDGACVLPVGQPGPERGRRPGSAASHSSR